MSYTLVFSQCVVAHSTCNTNIKMIKSNIEKIVIEKLSQLENGELENCPSGKLLAEEISKNTEFVKIYENYKLNELHH